MFIHSICCNLFQKYTKASPIKYLLDYRLQKKATLLLDTDLSITEICYHIGFASASYFTDYFKKRYDKTPSEFRKNQQ